MKTTKQAKREAKQLFRASIVNGSLDEGRARKIITQLVQTKPRGYVAILGQLHRLIKLEQARRTARVESASALPEDMRSTVRANLEKTYGPGLNISFTENPALLGGLRVRVGSDVYDGSIQARLQALEEAF